MADSAQRRLEIYAWMFNNTHSGRLLASVTFNFRIHIFTSLLGQKGQKLQNPKLLFLIDLIGFSIDFDTALLPHQILLHSGHFWTIYGTFQTFGENLKKIKTSVNAFKWEKNDQNVTIFGG